MLRIDKASAYAKRNNAGTLAPMELDSDPDFNSGIYIPEDKPKRRTKSAPGVAGKGRKRSRDEGDEDEDYELPKPKRKYRPHPQGPNPLLQYFDQEARAAFQSAIDDEPDEDEEQERDDDDDGKANMDLVMKTLLAVKRQPMLPPEVDSSPTESDTEEDDVAPHPPAPQRQLDIYDGSTTEEDEADDPTKPSIKLQVGTDSGSDTEDDEDESPVPVGSSMFPRPGFALKPGQQDLGPLVLDVGNKVKIPGPINTYLRDYQRDGAKFFYKLYKEGKGGLLGDDMGLGKTIQVISFLSAIMKKDGTITDAERRRNYVSKLQDGEGWKKRKQLAPADEKWPTCLIIAPSTVVHNWERELQTWGYFEVGMYYGNAEERKRVLLDFRMGRLDILVTSFDLARRDIDLLDNLPWSCIFVDEAHRLKNMKSQITQAYHQFACKCRFGLTGTAIQNSYEELYTILDWTNPGTLGTPKQWKACIQAPLVAGQSAGAPEAEQAKGAMVAMVLKERILPQLFLRRTKDIIRDQLPKKYDQVVFCPLSKIQVDTYKRILETDVVQNLVHKDDPCPCGSKRLRKKCCHPYKPEEVLRHVSILIKLSNHLALMLPSQHDSKEQMERNRELCKIVFPHGQPMFAEAVMQSQFCGKWDTLNTLLKSWKKDRTNKVLIFTKAVKLMDMLEFLLKERDYGFLKLDGSTKQSDRMGLIDKFQEDPNVFIFLISTLAGGTGLNLTSANHVVIFDPNWNPAHDLQAMDRAFRFGQTRDVYVYRLLGAGSLEEIIYARQVYKQQQMAIGYDASMQTRYFKGVQGDKQRQGELFGLKNLFSLQEDTLATKMAIEKAQRADLDWARINMSSKEGKKALSDEQKRLIESEKSMKEFKDDALQGLGTLLFDDDAAPEPNELDQTRDLLSGTGVKYVHLNDEIIAPSKINAERVKKIMTKTGATAGCRSGSRKTVAQPTAPWPPVRRHHKKELTLEHQLRVRQKALLAIEYIKRPDDLPAFARTLALETPEAQQKILRMLDEGMLKLADPKD